MAFIWAYVLLQFCLSVAQTRDLISNTVVQVEPISSENVPSYQAWPVRQPVTHLNYSAAPADSKTVDEDPKTRFLTPVIWESMGRLFLTQSQLSACSACTPAFVQQATQCCNQGFTACCFDNVSPYSAVGASAGSYSWSSPSLNYGYAYSSPYWYGQNYGYGTNGYGTNGYSGSNSYGSNGYSGSNSYGSNGYSGSSGYGSNGYSGSYGYGNNGYSGSYGFKTNGYVYGTPVKQATVTVGYARAGTCPYASPYSSQACSRQCTYDTDCSADYKCCAFGCSFICARPQTSAYIASYERPGSCPTDYSTTLGPNDVYYRGAAVRRAYYGKSEFGYGGGGSSGGYIATCVRDGDCPGSQKCCTRHSQRVCVSPYGRLSYGR